jgi:hypothetical protein
MKPKDSRRRTMPYGKGTYGSKVGRPSKAAKKAGRKKKVVRRKKK